MQKKDKITELKDFSIGRSDSSASFRNVKRIKKENMHVYYSVDVYGRKSGLRYKDFIVQSDNKKELREFLGKMFPYKVRKNIM